MLTYLHIVYRLNYVPASTSTTSNQEVMFLVVPISSISKTLKMAAKSKECTGQFGTHIANIILYVYASSSKTFKFPLPHE
jgi:predicted nucleic acid binding AN1-type Zn finger protein